MIKLKKNNFGVDFYDIRIEYTRSSKVQFINGVLTDCDERPSLGAFIRIFNRGRWFFAATTKVEILDTELKNLIQSSLEFPFGNAQFQVPPQQPCFKRLASDGFYKNTLSEKKELIENYNFKFRLNNSHSN